MSSPIDDSFPTPSAEDPDDVELALETAGALWNKGDRSEALRWVRRAAEAAEQAGNDHRALELARRAAELDVAPQPEPVIVEEPAPEAEPEPPPSFAAPPPSVAAPPPSVAAPAPSVAAPPPKPTLPVTASTVPEVRVSHPPAKPVQRNSVVPEPAPRQESPGRREPVRVYVKTSARDQSLLIVRPLEHGRRAPFGTREATLVFDEPS